MTAKPGDAFYDDPSLLQTTKGNHLWVVLAVYEEYKGCDIALLVNITTVYPRLPHDPACIVDQRDGHPIITHKSYAFYKEARLTNVQDLAQRKRAASVSQALLERLQEGLHRSRHGTSELRSRVPRVERIDV